MRNSARKNQRNRGIKSRLKTLEGNYLDLLATDKKEEAATALRAVSSALDKAVKGGVVHRCNADRKKSRLTVRLNKMQKAATPVTPPTPAPSAPAAPQQ